MTELSLDDLPRYSHWPARLLGLEEWAARVKTHDEILREYEREKWAPLLTRFREARAQGRGSRLDDVDAWLNPSISQDTLVTVNDHWELMTWAAARRRYLDLVASSLTRWSSRPPVVVELGAGYGGVLLQLLRRDYSGARGIGLDVSASGVALMSELASVEGLNVVSATCDLSSPTITDHAIPPGALCYTSYATSCVPSSGAQFITGLASFRPALVVHFEPLFEHAVGDTLLALLRRRYIEVNGYDRCFLTALREAAARGQIDIVEERPNVIGVNPLFAASIVAWRPR